MSTIQERLRTRRLELGLTLEEVGEAVGVTKATIQRYESGEIKNLKSTTIEKLAAILKTTPEYLMGWEDSVFQPDSIDPQISVIARASRKMTPEQIKKLREMAEVLFPDAFSEE